MARRWAALIFDESDRAVDDLLIGVGFRHLEIVCLNAGEIGAKRLPAVAGLDPIDQRLRVSEQFAVVAVGGQVPTASHDGQYSADQACSVGHGFRLLAACRRVARLTSARPAL